MKRAIAICGLLFCGLLLTSAVTNPSQLWYTANGGTKRKLADVLGDVVSVKGYPNLQAAINAVGANGTVYVPANYTETLTAGLTISNSGVTLRLEPSATITKGFNGNLVNITGNNVTIDGGTWDGNQAGGFTAAGIVVTGPVTGVVVRNAIIRNHQLYGLQTIGTAGAVSQFSFTGNRLTGNLSTGIYVLSFASNGLIANNVADNSAGNLASCYALHTTDGTATAKTIAWTGNTCINGAAGGFCMEIGPFGGLYPTEQTISGNTCTSTAGNQGGYSIQVTNSTLSGNSFTGGGFAIVTAPIECAGCLKTAITGNTTNGGTTAGPAIILDHGQDCTVSGNVVDNFSTSSGASGIAIVISAAGTSSGSNNAIVGNHVNFPASGTGLSGIQILAGHASAAITTNLISGNVITGNGLTGSVGIALTKSAGTLTQTLVSDNLIDSVLTGVGQTGDVASRFANNYFGTGVTTNYGGSGGTTPATLIFPDTGWTAVLGGVGFLNSWVNLGAPYEVASFYKDSGGFVHLRGAIKTGTCGQIAFVLPATYRPANTQLFVAISNDLISRIDINSTGSVLPAAAPCNNAYVSLNGITFDTR